MDDDIIRMAREAGLVREWMDLCKKDEEALVRFADLIRADEREACAKVCEERSATGDCYVEGSAEADGCAVAIRARSKE